MMDPFLKARLRWAKLSRAEQLVPLAFWEAAMAANAVDMFSDQRGVYGLADKGLHVTLKRLTGLSTDETQRLVEGLHSIGECDVRHMLIRLAGY